LKKENGFRRNEVRLLNLVMISLCLQYSTLTQRLAISLMVSFYRLKFYVIKWYPDTLHISLRKHYDQKQSSVTLPFCYANFFPHFRTSVPTTDSARLAKTLASTVAPVLSKAYYNDPDQSYPYYTIYDDDVSIYKDDGRQLFKDLYISIIV